MKKIFKSYKNNPPLIVTSIGLAIIFLPIGISLLVDTVNRSEIVGANIGVGVGFILGVPFVFLGFIWYGLTLKGLRKAIPIIIVFALAYAWTSNWIKQEDRFNKEYCEYKLERREEPIEGPDFCLKYINE